jgi:hypothetical protein
MPDQQSDFQSDDGLPDRVKPWTIKGISPEDRNAAVAAAEREGQTIGEYVSRALRAQVQADHRRDRAPALVGPQSVQQSDHALAAIERMIAAARSLAEVSGEPPPPPLQRLAYGLLRDQMKALKAPSGRTRTAKSPTDTPSGSDQTALLV